MHIDLIKFGYSFSRRANRIINRFVSGEASVGFPVGAPYEELDALIPNINAFATITRMSPLTVTQTIA